MSMQESGSPSSWLACTDGIATQWQDLLLLLARVLFGWTFVMSGWGKLMNIPGFVATMPRRGLPDFLGYVAPFVEFIGGVLIIAGLTATAHPGLDRGRPRQDERPLVHGEVVLGAGRRSRERP